MGPQTLIIKKGEHGAMLFTEDTIFSAPAYPMEMIYDPTGAGFDGIPYNTRQLQLLADIYSAVDTGSSAIPLIQMKT